MKTWKDLAKYIARNKQESLILGYDTKLTHLDPHVM